MRRAKARARHQLRRVRAGRAHRDDEAADEERQHHDDGHRRDGEPEPERMRREAVALDVAAPPQHELRQRQEHQRHQRRQVAMNEADRLPDVVQRRRRAVATANTIATSRIVRRRFVGGHARSYMRPSGSSCTIVIELARTGTMPVPSFNSGPARVDAPGGGDGRVARAAR